MFITASMLSSLLSFQSLQEVEWSLLWTEFATDVLSKRLKSAEANNGNRLEACWRCTGHTSEKWCHAQPSQAMYSIIQNPRAWANNWEKKAVQLFSNVCVCLCVDWRQREKQGRESKMCSTTTWKTAVHDQHDRERCDTMNLLRSLHSANRRLCNVHTHGLERISRSAPLT